MLRIAGAALTLVTLVEVLVLYPWARLSPLQLGLSLTAGNLVLVLTVGYFIFNSLPLGGRSMSGMPREGTLKIVQDTLPVLRQGLNRETASKTAEIIAQLQGVRAVMVTSRQEVLASAGGGWQDASWRQLVYRAARQAMSAGTPRIARLPAPAGEAPVEGTSAILPTPYGSAVDVRRPMAAVLVPLQLRREVVGSLALLTDNRPESVADLSRSGEIFAQILSLQIELGQLDRQAQLAAEAELNALRAQINPHFLFNTLNTIVSYSREDPEMARRLLLRLADLFRTTMNLSGQIITFAEEYQHVKNYLFIEQARFRERLKVVYDVDPQVLKVGIPALSVQPLVENAVRHGIGPTGRPGTVEVRARLDFILLRVQITVSDDGVGISPERIPELLRPRPAALSRTASRGVGLSNINERLRRLYGEQCSLQMNSRPGHGTSVHLRIPMR